MVAVEDRPGRAAAGPLGGVEDAGDPRQRPAEDQRDQGRRARREGLGLGEPQAVEAGPRHRLHVGPGHGQRANRHHQDVRADRAHFGWARPPRAATARQVTAYRIDRALRSQGLVSVASACHDEPKAKPAVRELIDDRAQAQESVDNVELRQGSWHRLAVDSRRGIGLPAEAITAGSRRRRGLLHGGQQGRLRSRP